MAISSIIKSSKRNLPHVGIPAAPGTTTLIAGFADIAQYQILNQWCWNAVGSVISEQLIGSAIIGDHNLQCNNANSYLAGASSCCTISVPGHGPINNWRPLINSGSPVHYNAGSVPCNQPGWPEWVTSGTGSLSSTWVWYSGNGPNSAEVSALESALMSGKPVSMYIDWGSSAHVVSIYGTYTTGGTRFYNIADPWDGITTATGAPSHGRWRGSMFTS